MGKCPEDCVHWTCPRLASTLLKILVTFKQGNPHYHFALSLWNHGADFASDLCGCYVSIFCCCCLFLFFNHVSFCLFVQLSGASLEFDLNSSFEYVIVSIVLFNFQEAFSPFPPNIPFLVASFSQACNIFFFHAPENIIDSFLKFPSASWFFPLLSDFSFLFCLGSAFYVRGKSRYLVWKKTKDSPPPPRPLTYRRKRR